MFVKNYITDDEYVLVAVCDVCKLPFEEEMDHGYHIHNACYNKNNISCFTRRRNIYNSSHNI